MYDVVVVGGGINGCGIARDAAGRGLKVLLSERADLASGTSSASTKLVHGGLRYLEHYEFRLVRESLVEREVLLGMAPHIIRPMRFILPHHRGLRPAWLIRLGLFLYDHLGGRRLLPPSRSVDLSVDAAGACLKESFRRGFEYSDCWVDDARLVILNARDAADRGADIRVHCELMSARREGDKWQLTLKDHGEGKSYEVQSRSLVNAAGPAVASVLSERIGANRRASVRLVKGSHIVVPKLFDHSSAYIFQNSDNRIVFAIPYEDEFTLIGTTDVDVENERDGLSITPEETDYLCAAVSEYFKKPVRPQDVVWSYAGVRPLFDDGSQSAQETTRDYVLDLDANDGAAPLLNVFGGKITTYRHLSEEAVDLLAKALRSGRGAWTRGMALPGGEMPVIGMEVLAEALQRQVKGLDGDGARRIASTYGMRARKMMGGCTDMKDFGTPFGAGLTEREVKYLVETEWARSAEDICWRRTKLGLRMKPGQMKKLEGWLKRQSGKANRKRKKS